MYENDKKLYATFQNNSIAPIQNKNDRYKLHATTFESIQNWKISFQCIPFWDSRFTEEHNEKEATNKLPNLNHIQKGKSRLQFRTFQILNSENNQHQIKENDIVEMYFVDKKFSICFSLIFKNSFVNNK